MFVVNVIGDIKKAIVKVTKIRKRFDIRSGPQLLSAEHHGICSSGIAWSNLVVSEASQDHP